MNDSNIKPAAALVDLINSYRISQIIHVAAKLGLADLLAEGPQSSDDLAERTRVNPSALYRLLRALSSLGLFREEAPGRFALTPAGAPLRTGVPDSVRDLAIFSATSELWHTWGELTYSVSTGEPAFQRIFGTDSWSYRQSHAEANALFNAAMTSNSRRDIAGVVAAYDFSGLTTLVDVGGGQGALLAGILLAYPALRGILFDQAHVVDLALPVLSAAGVAERCAVVAGDFFQEVPRGGDGYVLRRIIHDWDDAPSIAILRRCRDAMPDDGRLLLVEQVIQPANRPDSTKLADIHMLVLLGGRERTEQEFGALLAGAGLELTKVYSTPGLSSIVEAIPA
jgi:O-methyltransferase domain/Dimerisation domain